MNETPVSLIEADIEASRARLNSTIDRIQDRLTVSGIVDEVMGQTGVPRLSEGQDYVLGFLRRHPIPVMVVAAGIGWFMYRRNQRSAAEAYDAAYMDPIGTGFPVVESGLVATGPARLYEPGAPRRETIVDTSARAGLGAGGERA